MTIIIQYPAIAYRYSGSIRRTLRGVSRSCERLYSRDHAGTIVYADTCEKAERLDEALRDMFREKVGHTVFYDAATWLTDWETKHCAKTAQCEIREVSKPEVAA